MPDSGADFKGEVVTVEEAKISLGDLIAQANFGQKRFVITRYGKPFAAIVSTADLAKLEQENAA